jgi:hypothetical protein
MSKHLLPTAALLGLVSANANATTVVLLPPTTYLATTNIPAPPGSTGLGPFNPIGSPTGVGGISDPSTGVGGPFGFTAPVAGILKMSVAAAPFTLVGSVFQAFVDGVSPPPFFTLPVPLGGPTPSSGTFTVPISAGAHTFDVNDQLVSWVGTTTPPYGPAGSSVGASLFPTGVVVGLIEEIPSAIPEPTSLGLIGAWLLGLRLFRRGRAA